MAEHLQVHPVFGIFSQFLKSVRKQVACVPALKMRSAISEFALWLLLISLNRFGLRKIVRRTPSI